MDFVIKVGIPGGKLLKETDLVEFRNHIEGQIGQIAQSNDLTLETSTQPAPDGALGAEQLLTFVIENFESITQLTKHVGIILQAVNSLTQMFLKRKKATEDDESADKQPTVIIEVGDDSIELPANSKELDALLKDLRKKHENTKED